MVLVSTLTIDGRGLQLDPEVYTRALVQYEIHELICTLESVQPGSRVGDVAYVGFFEVQQGGMAAVDDDVMVDGRCLGRLAGFDFSHAPNHLNIVVHASAPKTGQELGVKLDSLVEIVSGSTP